MKVVVYSDFHGLALVSIAVAVVQVGAQNCYMFLVCDKSVPLPMLCPDKQHMVKKVRVCFPVPGEQVNQEVDGCEMQP